MPCKLSPYTYNGHLSPKLVLDLARLHCLGAVLADNLEQVCILLVIIIMSCRGCMYSWYPSWQSAIVVDKLMVKVTWKLMVEDQPWTWRVSELFSRFNLIPPQNVSVQPRMKKTAGTKFWPMFSNLDKVVKTIKVVFSYSLPAHLQQCPLLCTEWDGYTTLDISKNAREESSSHFSIVVPSMEKHIWTSFILCYKVFYIDISTEGLQPSNGTSKDKCWNRH